MPQTYADLCVQFRQNESAFVVYAKECNPTKLKFDEWRENKRASFGGDDGVEFIDLEETKRLFATPPPT